MGGKVKTKALSMHGGEGTGMVPLLQRQWSQRDRKGLPQLRPFRSQREPRVGHTQVFRGFSRNRICTAR